MESWMNVARSYGEFLCKEYETIEVCKETSEIGFRLTEVENHQIKRVILPSRKGSLPSFST